MSKKQVKENLIEEINLDDLDVDADKLILLK